MFISSSSSIPPNTCSQPRYKIKHKANTQAKPCPIPFLHFPFPSPGVEEQRPMPKKIVLPLYVCIYLQ